MSPEVRYLIVGGGMTGDAAARGVRVEDTDGGILMLTDEPHPPYDRPPLSKGLWAGTEEQRIWRDTEAVGVEVRTGVRAAALDPEAREIRDDEGRSYRYGKLLLATGARPRRLEGPDDDVLYFRTLEDYRALREWLEEPRGALARPAMALIGAGFIGCELASAVSSRGARPTLFFPEDDPLGLVLPREFAALLGRHLEAHGARLRPGVQVSGVDGAAGSMRVLGPEGGIEEGFDLAVAGLGVIPSQELAEEAGLAVDDGIVVDDRLETSRHGIFSAGDVARFPVPFLGGSRRVEHEDHANESGMLAGRNMAGAGEGYDPLPYFYSDVFEVGLEVLGALDGDGDPELHPPAEPEGPGAAIYRDGFRVRGVLLWNRPGKMPRLRRLLRKDPEVSSGEVLETLEL